MPLDYPTGNRARYQALKAALWSERSSFDSHWRELSEFMLPRRTRFWSSDRNKGDKRNQKIIDSTARFAARTLQSGLHAGLTSPARPWFNLTTPDPALAEHKPVQAWLHTVTQRMRTVFSDTNLYNVLPICYGDLGIFGTGAIGMVEDDHDLFRCYAYPIGSYAIGLDARNLATTFVREYELTVRQVVEQFAVVPGSRTLDWTNLSRAVHALWDQGMYEAAVRVCWVVTPNPEASTTRLGSRFLPWSSCHFEEGESRQDVFLKESGYRSFPILCPRWEVTGEDTYGTDCPGMTALGDTKQLQIMQKEKAKAIQKTVDPPLVGTPELRTQKTSLLPGDITYVREPQHGLRAIHEIALNIEHLMRDIGETQYRIQRAFYEDLFLMIATSDRTLGADRPTAREVDERHEEKLLALGPVLERTNDELLDPLIDRAFAMMDLAGLIPPPPDVLEGVALKVEYVSIMAQAQRLVGVSSQDRFASAVVQLVEVFPEVRYKIDVNRLVDNYAEMYGIDPNVVRETAVAEQMQAAAAAEQQKLADAQRMKDTASAIQSAGSTPMGTDSALDRLSSAVASETVQ